MGNQGKVFTGWTVPGQTGRLTSAQVATLTPPNRGTVRIVANWDDVYVQYQFMTSGNATFLDGSNEASSVMGTFTGQDPNALYQHVKLTDPVPMPANLMATDGAHELKGWSFGTQSPVASHQLGQTVTGTELFANGSTSPFVFYPVWVEKFVEVQYRSSDPDLGKVSLESERIGVVSQKTDTGLSIQGSTANAANGASFNGWTMDDLANTPVAAADETVAGTQLTPVVSPATTSPLKFLAHFVSPKHYVKYHQGFDYTADSTVGTAVTNATVPAKVEVEPSITKGLVAATAARPNYTFDGWYLDPTYNIKAPGADPATGDPTYQQMSLFQTPVDNTITLYAKWTEEPVVILYISANLDQGKVSRDRDVTYPHTGVPEVKGSVAQAKDGYHFVAWKKLSGNALLDLASEAWTPEPGKVLPQRQTLGGEKVYIEATYVALFAPDVTYEVLYDGNGATSDVPADQKDMAFADSASPTTPKRTGYTFDGWFFDLDEKGKGVGDPITKEHPQYDQDLVMGDATKLSVTLHAAWTPITYVVRFNPNGGVGSMENQDFTYDVADNLRKTAFTKKDKRFAGWIDVDPTGTALENASAKEITTLGTGTVYGDQASVVNLGQAQDQIVDLYALWVDDGSTTTSGGGSSSSSSGGSSSTSGSSSSFGSSSSESHSESKGETKSESKGESKSESKGEAKSEVKSETKSENKVQETLEPESEVRPAVVRANQPAPAKAAARRPSPQRKALPQTGDMTSTGLPFLTCGIGLLCLALSRRFGRAE